MKYTTFEHLSHANVIMHVVPTEHQQCNNDYSTKCNVIMHVVPTEHQAPFVKVIIGLVRHQAPFVKFIRLVRRQAPFVEVIRLVRRQAPFVRLYYAMTQLKCNDINIINSY